MAWERPDARRSRAAVALLIAAIFVATALAIALVVGAAHGSKGVVVHGSRVTSDTRAAGRGVEPSHPAPRASSTSTTATTATTAPAAPTSTTAVPVAPAMMTLPVPSVVPVDQYAKVPVTRVASIVIPRMGLWSPVYEGVWLTVLNVGPGHWPGTALPGGYGNVVIAGHRSTYSHPFERIGELQPGDPIVLVDATGSYHYEVTGSEIVTPDRLSIVDQAPGYTLTMFACHPPGSAQFRYVVHARLVSAPRPGV